MSALFKFFSLFGLLAIFFLAVPAPGSAAGIDLDGLTISQAREDIKNKKYTAKELTEAALARINQYNPGYNAIIIMNPNALKDAEAIDKRLARGEEVGPLAGIPVVIKDTMDVAGLPSTGGWAALSSRAGGTDLIPDTDAPVVARLRQAGAIILGKTNVPVMSLSGTNANNSWAGPTYNAAAPKYAPGASSSGTATAVASGMAIAGLAEETGGSIQNPAAAQGLVSIKPTFGLVPNAGVIPLAASTRDVIGPHARTVRDAALMLDVMAGVAPDDPRVAAGQIPELGFTAGLRTDALKGKRLGLYGPGWKSDELTPETRRLYAQAIERLKARGAVVVEDPFAGSGLAALRQGQGDQFDARGGESGPHDFELYLARMGGNVPKTVAGLNKLLGQDIFGADGPFALSLQSPAFAAAAKKPSQKPDLSEFLAVREAYLRIFNQVMAENQLDALIFPQMFRETPRLDSEAVIGATTVSEINIAGLPGVTVPAGYYASGAPFSIIFVGPLYDEAKLLGLAYDYEQATQSRKTPRLVEKPADLP